MTKIHVISIPPLYAHCQMAQYLGTLLFVLYTYSSRVVQVRGARVREGPASQPASGMGGRTSDLHSTACRKRSVSFCCIMTGDQSSLDPPLGWTSYLLQQTSRQSTGANDQGWQASWAKGLALGSTRAPKPGAFLEGVVELFSF